MTANRKLMRMDAKVRASFEARFSNAPVYLSELIALWTLYRDLELPNQDFIAELTNGKEASFAQRKWECCWRVICTSKATI